MKAFSFIMRILHKEKGVFIMYTFLTGIALLIIGYFIYGRFVEKVFGIKDARKTPAYSNQDGVDYLPFGQNKN